jgi:hypothetical protein
VDDTEPHVRAQRVGHKLTSSLAGGTAPDLGRPLSGYLMDVSITLVFKGLMADFVPRDTLCHSPKDRSQVVVG